jgi:hypothetical protein
MYVPGMYKNLLSVGKFADKGFYTLFGKETCWIFKRDIPGRILLIGTKSRSNGLYRLNSSLMRRAPSSASGQSANLVTENQQRTTELWHRRAGHLNFQSLYNLSKRGMVSGMPTLPLIKPTCEACVLGKHHRQPIPKTRTTGTTRPLELVHSDRNARRMLWRVQRAGSLFPECRGQRVIFLEFPGQRVSVGRFCRIRWALRRERPCAAGIPPREIPSASGSRPPRRVSPVEECPRHRASPFTLWTLSTEIPLRLTLHSNFHR